MGGDRAVVAAAEGGSLRFGSLVCPRRGGDVNGGPRTIHDFGGFPRELFEVEYPAPGSPELADRVAELLGDNVLKDESSWGLDHGTWSVLCHVFPEADVPVVQLSINEAEPAPFHYQLAQQLHTLRDEGYLVIGSGNLVHNLHTYAWGKKDVEPFDWALRFEASARELITKGDHAPLISYEEMGSDAMRSAPSAGPLSAAALRSRPAAVG